MLVNGRQGGHEVRVVEAYWNFKRAWSMNDL